MWRRITNSDTLFRFVTAGRTPPPGLILPDLRANVGKRAEWKAFYMVNRGDAKEDGEDSAILIPFPEARRRLEMPVTFDRRELDQILRIFSFTRAFAPQR